MLILAEMDKSVAPVGTAPRIVCDTPGTVQLIWTPA
jgi:hypothetical protein